MANWEYKQISSGKGGFASPALLEKFLNELGQEEWEIIEFRSSPENVLAFSGLARRPTQRDWTLEDAAAAAARNEAEKLRAEFEAKFRGMAPSGAEPAAGGEPVEEKPAGDDGLRHLRDTAADQDPDAPEEPKDEWDLLGSEDELPTFFGAIRPMMRRNQRGPGMSVGVDHLARRWELTEAEIKSALQECGLVLPEDEDAAPEYVEVEGDLYWVNMNRRGELWINTKEKARPKFRTVAAQKVTTDEALENEPADGNSGREGKGREGRRGSEAKESRDAGPPAPLPEGEALLEKIRPQMRRDRRGAMAGSGSTGFLSRALRCKEPELVAALNALGLVEPKSGEKPTEVRLGEADWWVNRDGRGGLWINYRGVGEPAEPAASVTDAPAGGGEGASHPVLAAVRLLLKKGRTGSFGGEIGQLAQELKTEPEAFVEKLTATGLKVPEKPREKPVFVEHAGEIFWLNRNAKNELWLNAKASKFSQDGDGPSAERKAARRGRKAKESDEPESPEPADQPAASG